jgi:hypothetical protein
MRTILRMRRIHALVWFDAPANGVDLRFSSPHAALHAFRSAAQPDVAGFVWFHMQKEADWRINSSDASAAAFKSALAARRTP